MSEVAHHSRRSSHLANLESWGLTGNYAGETDTFVELKTSLAIRGQRDEANFERYDCASRFSFWIHADGWISLIKGNY